MKVSAGILLYRDGEGPAEVLLVHPGGPFWGNRDLGAWSIPKGEVTAGEDPLACALRELREELGPAPEIDREALLELGSVRQKAGKLVHAWAAEGDFDPEELRSNPFTMEWPPRSGAQRQFPEVDRAAWFELGRAREKILTAQVEFIDRLLVQIG